MGAAAMKDSDPSNDLNLPANPIVFANQSFLDLSGYSMIETAGQPLLMDIGL